MVQYRGKAKAVDHDGGGGGLLEKRESNMMACMQV